MKLSSSILIGLLVLVATVLSTGVDARRNRGLQDMDAEYGDDSDVVYADGPPPPPSPSSYSSSSSSGKGDCGADNDPCCFGDTQLCFQGHGCDVKMVDSKGKPWNPEDDMNITCTKNCGDEHQPCCYDLCPGQGSKGSKGTGKGGSKGDSSSEGDDCDCKCNPGLYFDISTKTCEKCGRCEKGKKFANGIGTPLDSELDEITKRAGGGDDLQADFWGARMCHPCCEGDTCDPGHVCTASGMCERCGEDRSGGRLKRSGRDKRQPCCIKEEMVRVTKEPCEESCPSASEEKSGWCEPEEEWVLKTVHKCNAGNVCQADGKCSKCGDVNEACCDDGCTPANSECGPGSVCKCKDGYVDQGGKCERLCPGPYTFPNGETELGYGVSVTWASADTNMIARVYFYDDNNNMISKNDDGGIYGLLGPPNPPFINGIIATTFQISPIASCLTDKILIEPYSFTGPQNPPDEKPWLVTRIALHAASVEGGAFNKVVEFKLKGGELLIDDSYYLYTDRYPKLV